MRIDSVLSYLYSKRFKIIQIMFGVLFLGVVFAGIYAFVVKPIISIKAAPPTPTITWLGGTDSSWNTAANWDTGLIPDITDDVLITSAAVNLVIPDDTNLTINSLTLAGSTTLTIQSVNTGSLQDAQSITPIVTKLAVTTSVFLEDTSVLTHPANAATTNSPYTLNLDIGGDLSIDDNAKIDVTGKGYAGVNAYRANPGVSGANITACNNTAAVGGQYGGQAGSGAYNAGDCLTSDPYGNVKAPTDLGSGGRTRYYISGEATAGGGAIRINATGAVLIDGSIVSNGPDSTGTLNSTSYGYSAGSGGSIYITANQVSGSGNIQSNGGSTTGTGANSYYGPGSGGRIAISSIPFISSLSTDRGPTAGGSSITITGDGFVQGLTNFYFDTIPALDVVISNQNTATVTVPDGIQPGFVDVSTSNTGSPSSGLNFTGTVSASAGTFAANTTLASNPQDGTVEIEPSTPYLYGRPFATIIWTGTTNSDWNTATNWNTNQVPTTTDDVFITFGEVDLVIPDDTNLTINSLTLIGSATLNIQSVNTGTLQDEQGITPIETKLVVTTSVYLEDTSILTHPTNLATTNSPYTLNLDIGGDLSVDTNAKIDVTAKGYAGVGSNANGTLTSGGNTSNCTSYGTSGGVYGGMGGISGSCTSSSAPYGNVKAPIDLGSGGRSRAYAITGDYISTTSGGGAVRINATNITVDGLINANGGNTISSTVSDAGRAHTAGSGGSVYITAFSVDGVGTITTNGGSTLGTGANSNYGPGGGGRISVNTTGSNSLTESQYQAYSGARGTNIYTTSLAGAAGTIYILDDSSTYGNLIIDNVNHTVANSTAWTGIATSQFDDLTITNGGRLDVVGNLEFDTYIFKDNYSTLNVSGDLTYNTTNDFVIDTSNFNFILGGIFTNTNTNFIVKDTTATNDTASGNNITINSNQTLNSIDINSDFSTFTVNSTLDVSDDITLTDVITSICSITASTTGSGANLTTTLNTVNLSATNLTLNGTAVLTHCENGSIDTDLKTLNIDLSENLTINEDASIDVTGKGYAGIGSTYNGALNSGGNITNCTNYGAVGGVYGGIGGIQGSCTSTSTPYGNLKEPVDLGSGGRSRGYNATETSPTAGGGAVRINASNILLDGSINANGVDNNMSSGGSGVAASTGSGGSVYITAGNISGNSDTAITTNGGSTIWNSTAPNYGPGGGGRIAVHTTGTNSLIESQYQAYSGAKGNGNYTVELAGAAGTIYLFDDNTSTYGSLIINNANHAAANSTAVTGTAIQNLYQYDYLSITQGGRLNLTGDLEFTSYDFKGDYSALTVTGSITNPDDFIIDASNFYFTLNGEFANVNTDFTIKDSSMVGSETATGNVIVFNNSQQINSIDINSDSSTLTINGNLTTTGNVNIAGDSSTNTINGIVNVAEDITLTDGETIVCSITASTTGSGAGLTTTLNTVNLSAANLTLDGTAKLTHCANGATDTILKTLNIELEESLIITEYASIDVSEKGYAGVARTTGLIPGPSGANNGNCSNVTGTLNIAIGGQYGSLSARAGPSSQCLGVEPYGNYESPLDIGSGGFARTGGSNYANSTFGGGAIRIKAINSVVIDGTINANGEINTISIYYAPRAIATGSGGSVYITTSEASGSGSITANGGNITNTETTDYYAPGGGGRIAINNGTSINSITKNSGPINGGNTVTVSGMGFVSGVTKFYFDSNIATNVNVINENTATMTVPAGLMSGVVDVISTNAESLETTGIFIPTENITTTAGTRTVTGTNVISDAEDGTVYLQDTTSLAVPYTYLDVSASLALDDICANSPILSITPISVGAISNINCTASATVGSANGYTLFLSLSENGLDQDFPLDAITNESTGLPATFTNPELLRANTFGFAVPKVQSSSTGLTSSGFDDTYPIVSSILSTSHQYKYAAFSESLNANAIKITASSNSTPDPTEFIIATNVSTSVIPKLYELPITITVVGNI